MSAQRESVVGDAFLYGAGAMLGSHAAGIRDWWFDGTLGVVLFLAFLAIAGFSALLRRLWNGAFIGTISGAKVFGIMYSTERGIEIAVGSRKWRP